MTLVDEEPEEENYSCIFTGSDVRGKFHSEIFI
jgi:hypothetical protein